MGDRRFKMIISYDGTRYYGWEHQPDKETVQGKLENVLQRLAGTFCEIIGAGRTDAGVHAKGMCAHFSMDTELAPEEIKAYFNRYLPDDIAVLDLREASGRFHARYNATGKTYCYTIYQGSEKPVFDRKYVWTIEQELDTERMKKAAAVLTGRHDYAAFCKAAARNKSTVRTVDTIEIRQKGGYITLRFHGDGFLRNMVRIMTGAIVAAGRGELTDQDLADILASRDRKRAPATAPAQGLCLEQVDYD